MGTDPFGRPLGEESLRWDMLAGSPTDLVGELAMAREALRQHHLDEADTVAARLLRRAGGGSLQRRPVITQPLAKLRGSALVIRGLAARQQRRHDDAQRWLKDAVAILGELASTGHYFDPTTLADYGTALALTGRSGEESGPVTEALEADAEVAPDLALRLGEALRRGGRHDRAARLLRAAHQRYPRHADIAASLAQALERVGDQDLSVDAHMSAGMLLAGDGRLDRSLDHFRRAKRLAPETPLPALAQAQVLLVTNQLKEAEQTIGEILKDHPDLAGGYALLALLQARKGAGDAALDTVDEALDRFGKDPWLLASKIQLLLERGDLGGAREALGQALQEVDSSDPNWLRLYAEVLRRTGGSIDEVIGVLRRLTASAPDEVEHHLALADVLAGADQVPEALEALGSALQLHPRDPRLLGRQAELLALQGRHWEAAASAREALAQAGKLPQVSTTLARALLAAGDAAAAVEAATQALRDDPRLVAARRTRGLARARLGRLEEAIKDLEKVISTEPDDREAMQELVQVLERRGRALIAETGDDQLRRPRLEEARRLLERAVELDRGHPGVQEALGEILLQLGDLQAAVDHLDVAVGLQESARALGKRGQVRRRLGQPEAIDDLRRAVELDPDLAWAQADLGEMLRTSSRFREATAALTAAVGLDASKAWVWASKGAAEFGLGLYEEALRSLDRALELHEGDAWTRGVKGSLLFRIDELEPALELVNAALADEPSLWWVWVIKGWLLDYLQGDAKECEDAFQKAVDGNPNSLDALIGVGEALIRQQRPAEAGRCFTDVVAKAREHADLDANGFHGLGWSLLRLGRYEEAVQALGEAARRDQDRVEADFDMALTLLCWGQADVAVEEYEAAAGRTRTIRHRGRRRSVVRTVARDLVAVLPAEYESPELMEVYSILASIPWGDDEPAKSKQETPMKLLFIPAAYKCSKHSRDLTEEVRAKVEATPSPSSSFGWRRGRARRPQEPFRVKIRCPEGEGHDLFFRGTVGQA
jgi:tetratricopeptide (TPR) repeat protein